MGTVEQDLARYEREQDEAEAHEEALERARVEIRETILSSVDELVSLVAAATFESELEARVIASMIVRVRNAKAFGEIVVITGETLADIYIALEPYIVREVEERAPRLVKWWKAHAEQDRAAIQAEDREAYFRDRDSRGL